MNNPYQQRLMQMYNQQQPQQQIGFQIIPVTNEQEARVSQIDIMNGTPSFFYNKNLGEVYLKQVNQFGTADFIKFAKVQEPLAPIKEENNAITYEKDFKALNDKIDGLYKILNSKEVKNAK